MEYNCQDTVLCGDSEAGLLTVREDAKGQMAASIPDSQILDAALEVIIQRGYTGATTREIAAAAGINEVTLFRRFGNKESLLRSVVEAEATAFIAADIEYTGDLEADLLRIVDFYHYLMTTRGRIIALMIVEIPRQPELMTIWQTPLAIIHKLTALIERYQREGSLVEEPPVQAFVSLVGPLFLGNMLGSLQTGKIESLFDSAGLVRLYLQGRVP